MRDFLFGSPIFTSTNFIEEAKIPAPSARRILSILADNRLLKTLRKSSDRRLLRSQSFWTLPKEEQPFDDHP